ncbi:type I-E CRISPR-associated protein Cas5/CasD [Lactobacillus taiwanensis]|uniref:type I-E CRISPR-associated protein Cas5/CasD n=1 Tax=Lactobacillus taiwanensis TaxID=508451 RepID=UPI00242A68C6|nr:type I-E CRISPR-associated protein Cas5/CasD [Lactobacillus taiwanensis]
MKTLTIKLKAPLQAYGNEATFGRRTTNPYPTKSAVIGMISASLGYGRNDKRILELNNLSFAVRSDQPGQVVNDFQIVEYAKSATKKAKKLTYRYYLQDAIFMVAIGSENEELIEKIHYALQHPKFPLFLGRRSCPPAGPLEIEVFNNQNPLKVLKSMDWQAAKWYQRKHSNFSAELVYDANLGSKDNFTFQLKDKVGSFDQRNRYHDYREVVSTYIPMKHQINAHAETTHDIMSNI